MKRLLLVFAAFWALYLITASDNGWHNDGLVRWYVARSLVTEGDPVLREAAQGEVSALWAVVGQSGELYSFYGAGHSLAMVPAVAVHRTLEGTVGSIPYLWDEERFWLGMVAPVLAALAATSMYGAARAMGHSEHAALLTAGVAGLATNLWPHSRDLHDNLMEAAFIALSLALVLRARAGPGDADSPLTWSAAAGAALGVAFVTRSSAVLALPALMLVLGGRTLLTEGLSRRLIARVAAFGAGMLATGWVWFAYNLWRFGSPFDTGYAQMFLRDAPIPGQPILPGAAGLLVSPWHGLLLYVPAVWLFPLAAAHLPKRERWLIWGALLTLAAYTLFYASFRQLGYWSYGPGYLLPTVPWLILPLVVLFSRWRALALPVRGVVVSVLALSVLAQLPGVVLPIARVYAYVPPFTTDEMQWFSLRWAPMRVLAVDGLRAVGNVLTGREFVLTPDANALLTDYVALNAPEWWWVAVYYRGLRVVLVVPLLLLGVSGGAIAAFLSTGTAEDEMNALGAASRHVPR